MGVDDYITETDSEFHTSSMEFPTVPFRRSVALAQFLSNHTPSKNPLLGAVASSKNPLIGAVASSKNPLLGAVASSKIRY